MFSRGERIMERLINKTNNIERNVGQVERYYRLDGRIWYIGREKLFLIKREATEEEIKEFLKLKKEFEQ